MLSLSGSLLGLLLASPVFSSAIPQALESQTFRGGKSALYFLENDPAGAKLAAVQVASDGKLSAPTQTSTGGNGAVGIMAGNNTELVVDTLIGQGAVAVGGDYVFTVNAGSNTVSMFAINPRDPTHPKLVGKPADTLGEFPVSVTYSPRLKTACVLNGGARNGVTCFSVSKDGLKAFDTTARPLSQWLHTTTPPQGPPATASQIEFSPDSSVLVVSIKGQPATNTPGTILVYPVSGRKVSPTPTATQIKDIIMDFGFSFLDGSTRIFLSDPTFGGSIVSIQSRGNTHHASEVAHVVAPGQKASCWAAYSDELRTAYAVDAGLPRMAVVPLDTGKLAGFIDLDPATEGAFDTVVRQRMAFFLGKTGTIGVVDLVSRKMVQTFAPGAEVGRRQYWQGLALWGGR